MAACSISLFEVFVDVLRIKQFSFMMRVTMRLMATIPFKEMQLNKRTEIGIFLDQNFDAQKNQFLTTSNRYFDKRLSRWWFFIGISAKAKNKQ